MFSAVVVYGQWLPIVKFPFLAPKWPEKEAVKCSDPQTKSVKTLITTVEFRFREDILRSGENAHTK
jgi:hypothetical protein